MRMLCARFDTWSWLSRNATKCSGPRRSADVLRRVEPESVEVELVDPVSGVRDRELPGASRALAVIVDRFAPLGGAGVHVRVGELRQVVAVRAEVIVDDVEDHGDSTRLRR